MAVKKLIAPLILFFFTLTIYTILTLQHNPPFPYHHHLYTAESFLNGRFDVVNVPDYYHDLTSVQGRNYVPFGPSPAFILLPFVAIFGRSLNPQFVGAFIGAMNVTLVYFLIKKIRPKLTTNYQLLTTNFFAFGTVHFYSVFIGSTWYFAHIVGVFFMLLALNFSLQTQYTIYNIRYTILTGVSLGLAVLARTPMILSLPFFIALFVRKKPSQPSTIINRIIIVNLLAFFIGFAIPIVFQLFYNHARFNTIFQDGHAFVYNNYKNFPVPVTIFQQYWQDFPLYNFLDIRNIPLHFYTAFLLLPKFTKNFPFMEFSPFGTSMLFTSPFLWLVPIGLLKLRKNNNKLLTLNFELLTLFTALLIMFGVFFHFTQGWVQFGYRFLLDFLPFLLISLAYAVDRVDKRIVFALFSLSIAMNTLGVIYGAR